MTRQELLDVGFREFPSTGSDLQRWDILYQKRIRDKNGTRYFIDVTFWQHSKYPGGRDGWQVEVNYNDGCTFSPVRAMGISGDASNITASDAIEWADQLWQRLCPNYYERDQ